jgi:anti-anti-sigma factor
MEISELETGAVTVFELRGRLTLESFGSLKTRVRTVVTSGARALVLDLSAVSYIDSIGVAELVRCHVMTARQGGCVALAAIPAHIDQLLKVTRLDEIFIRFDTRAQAVECLA